MGIPPSVGRILEQTGFDVSRGTVALVTGEIIIHRPVEEVFDFVAGERNEPRYNPRLVSAKQISSGPIASGTRFRADTTMMRQPVPMAIELTAHDRPTCSRPQHGHQRDEGPRFSGPDAPDPHNTAASAWQSDRLGGRRAECRDGRRASAPFEDRIRFACAG
jgi:hypothetical protein